MSTFTPICIALITEEDTMANTPISNKFPDGSLTRDYDIFEELPDGTPIWRACVLGMKKVESSLFEMAKETNNRIFAVNLQDRSLPIIRPYRLSRQQKQKAS
jgi:hypothetical protein